MARLSWVEGKNQANQRKYGMSFDEAKERLFGPAIALLRIAARHSRIRHENVESAT